MGGPGGDSRRGETGLVFNVQRFSVHDGPGIRTLVFMKGCPLRCSWCSNPESQNCYPELGFVAERCIGTESCGACIQACPTGAASRTEETNGAEDLNCTNCGKCAEACPAKARRLFGEHISVHALLNVLEEDGPFYWRSGGGITVSGGEPLLQADFVEELLQECQGRGLDTGIETTGFGRWEDLERLCRYANIVLFDLKHLDPTKHRALTGVSNEPILENLQRLSRVFPNTRIIARTPVVPGLTDDEANIRAVAIFLSRLRDSISYELLPYHAFGEPKYRQLGRAYPLGHLRSPCEERMALLRRIVGEFLG